MTRTWPRPRSSQSAVVSSQEREVGTLPTLIRLSVGLEHADELWRDLARALA
jgi:cystathionine beta-lyase/cystathionine gamma-synthase